MNGRSVCYAESLCPSTAAMQLNICHAPEQNCSLASSSSCLGVLCCALSVEHTHVDMAEKIMIHNLAVVCLHGLWLGTYNADKIISAA